eukprot:6457271-Amphidinium_carterae.1
MGSLNNPSTKTSHTPCSQALKIKEFKGILKRNLEGGILNEYLKNTRILQGANEGTIKAIEQEKEGGTGTRAQRDL